MQTPDWEASQRAFEAMMTMAKIDTAAVQSVYDGA